MNASLAWPFRLLPVALVGTLLSLPGRASEVGFIEDFSLSTDRAAALKQLIPGTEDYYYYNALHLLNTEQYGRVAEFTTPWYERFRQTPRYTEIKLRHALLTYEKDPKFALSYITGHLGLYFNHQRETVGVSPALPSVLDQKLFAREVLKASSFSRWSNLSNFEDSSLDWLAAEDLTWERRRELLQRLQRPDLPNLPKLLSEDFRSPHASSFGAFAVHRLLTLDQLRELLKLVPSLINDGNFVQTWASRLQPGADSDWRRDRGVARAYFERLEAFTAPLPPVHNALKAHVLFHRLSLDRSMGVYDKDRFLAYLKLPRQQHYMARSWSDRPECRDYPAPLSADFSQATLLPPVNADEELVRAYLKHFLLGAAGIADFEAYVDNTYLTYLFAEVKAENGLGDPESWASKLPPDRFAALRDRIDIDFAPTNKTDFRADELVKLDLHVKNVPTLLVKVFEVNAQNFYRSRQREVDTDLNLDGLVPNVEQSHAYAEAPLHRVKRTFELPQLDKPGVYVVDFIGAGKSSRALIRKGRLKPITTTGTAGQNVLVVDEANKPVPGATVWLGGQEYPCDDKGIAVVPFTASPGRRVVVLGKGNFASLDTIDHQPETYRLEAGIHVDRESLIAQRTAALLVRPALFLNNQPVSLKLLENVSLRIIADDGDGVPTSTEVPDFKLFEDRESVHDFRVPARLRSLSVVLRAKVKSLSLGKPIDLATGQGFALNGIDHTNLIEDLHLTKFGPDYVVELLGRTGEPKFDRPVEVNVKHRDFKEQVRATLKTDVRGRVVLGPLGDITSVTVTGPERTTHTWALPVDDHSYRGLLHAKAGDIVAVPYLGSADKPTRAEFALLETRGKGYSSDRFESLSIKNGLVEARGLEPGDYELWLKREATTIRIRVGEGPTVGGFVLGKVRELELPKLRPVQIASIEADAAALTVRLTDANKVTRVHILASRYLPEFSAFGDLSQVRDADLTGIIPTHPESTYLTGRNIGDEYRYVLDRRGIKRFPGNMLDRPKLLLNPWAIRSTEAGEQDAKAGEMFQPKGPVSDSVVLAPPAPPTDRIRFRGESDDISTGRPAVRPNLDFLAETSSVVLNVVPDKDGIVRIDRKRLGGHPWVHVAAIDPLSTTVRSISLAEEPVRFLDLRLKNGLDPNGHFTQQKQVSVLVPGKPFTIADIGASRFEAYDSLAKVYALYATLSKDPKLEEFSFILTWPKLKEAEKREKYSKHACHELHFFLAKRDPAFFNAVVKPYLANKKDKTFLDHFLLGDDLSRFLEPYPYSRLNTVERVLLAQRIDGEPERTARHLGDLLALLPPDVARDIRLFETAVQSGELATGGEGDFRSSRDKRERMQGKLDDPIGAPVVALPVIPTTGAAPPPGPATASEPAKRPSENKEKLEESFAREGQDRKDMADGEKESGLKKSREMGDFFTDARAHTSVRQLYRKVDPTMEWAENNYYKLRIHQQIASLVGVSPFWVDYAKHAGNGPFLSRHLAGAGRNFTEMMFALSVLDLPFEPAKHLIAFKDAQMDLGPASPVIAFHEEVRAAAAPDGSVPVLVGQNFYRPNDRYEEVNGERVDKFVTGEYLVNTVYGCQVVVTNPTSSRQRLSVLVQLPIGALPLANAMVTRSVPLVLEPYHTGTVDYSFYFPKPGKFPHFPAQVAKSEKLVAAAKPTTFDVLAAPTKRDTSSWDYISQFGTDDEVIAFLNRENVSALNLGRIAFRMKDRAFFERTIVLLRQRHAYDGTLWSYALFHDNAPIAKEYLTTVDSFAAQCGGPIDTPLFTLHPVARHSYEHLEYSPLVNARAHSLGRRRQIVNAALHEQYHRFLKTLSYRKSLDDTDLLATVYYLLLQDRIEEAQTAFGRVNPERVATRLQYDFCAAYLAMSDGDAERARNIAARHHEEPVDRWRNAFASVVQQADEALGRGPAIAAGQDPMQRQDQLAATEPAFEVVAADRGVSLTWQNLKSVTVNYYLMDVELLFSRRPFAQASDNQFAVTKPHATKTVELPANEAKLSVPLPADLASRNVLVEVTAAGKTRSVPYFATAMDVKLVEAYGQATVLDPASKPLGKVYVKVYAKFADGSVKFHKDGYTDLRGRFDYVSVNSPERRAVERFAVLVLSEDRGAVIREAAPPQQ